MIMGETGHYPAGEKEREMKERTAMATAPATTREVLGGYIFIFDDHPCSMQFIPKRSLFGMTHQYKDPTLEIIPGTPLFIFDCKTSHAYGVYEAISPGGMNLDELVEGTQPSTGLPWPRLLFTGESAYHAQVCVRLAYMYPPLPARIFWKVVGHYAPDAHLIRLTVPQVSFLLEVFEVNQRICNTISAWGAD